MRQAAACVLIAACGAASGSHSARRADPVVVREATVDELVRVRCALDGAEVITTWTGSVFAFAIGGPPRELFGVTGMNIARCLRDGDRWYLTSRELMLYLDPTTREPISSWTNPWTGATVPVMHVANSLVQNELRRVPISIVDGTATISIDVPLQYPNPLASDSALRQFSPMPRYEAGEFFTLSAPAAALATGPTVPTLQLVWYRVGPWLPWMAMGERPGTLIYSARGRKLFDAAELPEVLQRVIDETVPVYRHAPRCRIAGHNVTSWTYFADHVAAYLAKDSFPVPEPERDDACI